jgi:NADPH-dependent 2,4-dienoyl-CoA reductase/sulfur reductase-like enzyme
LAGGPAGTSAAQQLRALGFEGRLVMVNKEDRPPYDRTMLSKMYLSGKAGPERLPLRPETLLRDRRAELLIQEVASLDPHAQQVTFADGTAPLRHDAVLLATGGEPKMPSLPGSEPLPYLLRTVEDADRLLDASRLARHVVLIGSSFISMEAASAFPERGSEVTVISQEKIPFVRQFGPQLGQMLLGKHLQNGVRFLPETKAIRAHALGRKQVIELDGGEQLVADFVVSGVGVKGATRYVHGISLNEDGGINVDATMRVEGTRNVYAAGDLAAFPLPQTGARTRIEHWRVPQEHGRIAAANMLGLEQPYEGVPYFWTYHYGVRYGCLGHPVEWDSFVVDGNFEKPEFIAAFVREGRCIAAFAANRETETARLFDQMRRVGPLALERVKRVTGSQ